MKLPMVDVVVVGAGGAGGIVAEQLALAGFDVALLERGRAQEFSETGHDELRSQRTTGCHGLSPSHDTAIRAMIRTVNANSTKPMTL